MMASVSIFFAIFLAVALALVFVLARSIRVRFPEAIGLDSTKEAVKGKSQFVSLVESLVRGSGVDIMPSELTAIMMVPGLLLFIIGLLLNLSLILSFALGIVGFVALPLWLRMASNKNREKFDEQIADAMPMIASNLRVGLSLRQSLVPVGEALNDPLKTEFGRVGSDIAAGLSTAQALKSLAERTQSGDIELFASAVEVQSEFGGSIADVVDQVGETVRQRNELRQLIKARTAMARVSVYAMIIIPIVLAAFLISASPSYLDFYTTMTGMTVLAVCAISELVGFFVMRHMSNLDLE